MKSGIWHKDVHMRHKVQLVSHKLTGCSCVTRAFSISVNNELFLVISSSRSPF